MVYFTDLLSKEGEDISHYVHSWESSRNSTTNLKVSKWATATTVSVVVRSQPSFVEEREEGVHKLDIILVLTITSLSRLDVIKWQNKYYDILMVEEVFFRGTREYYKATCQERLEFIGN